MTDSSHGGANALRSSPVAFLIALSFINWLGFAFWQALLNNFAKEQAGFTGADMGLLQSVREIPGFLAFTAVAFFLVMREQTLAYVSLLTLGVGVAVTGYYPSVAGLLVTTTIMSLGFHYLETANQSLQLQLLSKAEAPSALGRIAGWSAVGQIIAYATLWLSWDFLQPTYQSLYLFSGLATIALTLVAMAAFKRFQGDTPQRKGIVLRRSYGLYYALTFMSGARRQIFVAFGGFLLVEHFGLSVGDIAKLFMASCVINTVAGPKLGALIGRLGERRTIMLENVALIGVFLGYALASQGVFGRWGGSIASALFVFDGVVFIMMIAQKTYFQKIADPADIAPTAAVAFTINHIAAVVLPLTFGLIWIKSPAIVFFIGVAIALTSLAMSFLVPHAPARGAEFAVFGRRAPAPAE